MRQNNVAMRKTFVLHRALFAVVASMLLAACGGGSGGSGGGSGVTPSGPSGTILFGVAGGPPITTSPSSPYPVNMSGGTGGGPFTAQESGLTGDFTVTMSCSTSACAQFGPSLVPSPASFPSGGLFTFRCGLLCVRDFHVESATISDGAGHSIIEYFEVV
jgi:hypothetical protein